MALCTHDVRRGILEIRECRLNQKWCNDTCETEYYIKISHQHRAEYEVDFGYPADADKVWAERDRLQEKKYG